MRRALRAAGLFFAALAAAARAAPATLQGVVGPEFHRPVPRSSEPAVEALLERYRTPARAFRWEAVLRGRGDGYALYDVHFPSPVRGRFPELNTVWCEYFRAAGDAKRPAVVLLHILGPSDFALERLVAVGLTSAGVDVALMKMPYYGRRRPKTGLRVSGNLDALVEAIEQSAHDARRTAEWLASLPWVDGRRIGLCGISLGAFVAGLTAGVDAGFPRVGLVLGGGDLAGVVWNGAKEVRAIKEQARRLGLTRDALAQKLRIIDPNTYAPRLTRTRILMINGRRDRVVPPACARSFWIAAGKPPIVWYDCGHYDGIVHLFEIIGRLKTLFKG